jgi:hypothetical protein
VINVVKKIANLLKSFGNETVVLSSSEYDINKKEDLKSFKAERPTLFLP